MPRILITRSPHQASELADQLRAVGVEPILIPTIELVEPSSFVTLDDALGRLNGFQWLIFTSANAVEAFGRRAFAPGLKPGEQGGVGDVRAEARTLQSGLVPEGSGGSGGREQHGGSLHPNEQRTLAGDPAFDSASQMRDASLRMTDFREGLKPDSKGDSYGIHSTALRTGYEPVPLTRQSFDNIKIAAIGPATARTVEELFGRAPDLVPPQAVAESLAEALLPYAKPGVRFLLVRAQLDRSQAARDPIPYTLRATGAELTIAPAYRTVIPRGSAEQIKFLFSASDTWPDAITFTSSSTATNLFALLGDAGITLPPEILRASIGPITSQTLRELGYPPQVEAVEVTVAGLVEALVKGLGQKQKP